MKVLLFTFSLVVSNYTHAILLKDILRPIKVSQTNPRSISLIEESSLRLGVSEADEAKNNYSKNGISVGVRLKPESFNSYKLKKTLLDNQKKRYDFLKKNIEMESNANTISNYINVLYSKKILKKLEDALTLYRDKEKVITVLFKKGQGDVSDILKITGDFKDIKRSISEYKTILANSSQGLRSIGHTSIINPQKLKPISVVAKSINDLKKIRIHSLKQLSFEQVQLNNQSKLENAQTNKVIDFIELGVDHSVDHDQFSDKETDTKVFIKLSLNLPVGNNNSLTLNEKELKRISSESRHGIEVEAMKAEDANLLSDLLIDINEYKTLSNSILLKEAKNYLKIYSRRKGTAPLKILGFNEIITKFQIEKLTLEKQIYTKYVQFLLSRGLLSSSSAVNYFQ